MKTKKLKIKRLCPTCKGYLLKKDGVAIICPECNDTCFITLIIDNVVKFEEIKNSNLK